jgi:hypothetical protein
MSSPMPWLKAIEVLGVLGAGAAFVWWQWRDVTRAQEQSRREREAREARATPGGDRTGSASAPHGQDRSAPPSERAS